MAVLLALLAFIRVWSERPGQKSTRVMD